jgi:hypothetical protein
LSSSFRTARIATGIATRLRWDVVDLGGINDAIAGRASLAIWA